MKIYKLTFSSPYQASSQLSSVMGSYRQDNVPTKTEYFKTLELAERRKIEINHLFERINLTPWFISVQIDEIEVVE